MTPRIGEDFVQWRPPTGGDETLGIVDFSIFPHLDHEGQQGNTMAEAESWAAGIGALRTRSTTRPPSRWSTAPSRSSPRGSGNCSPLGAVPFTLRNIKEDLEDLGPRFDGAPDLRSSARRPRHSSSRKAALSYQRVPPGYRFPYGHTHVKQEEVYVVVRGSGRMKLDDEIVELKEWDAVRVPPGTWRGRLRGRAGRPGDPRHGRAQPRRGPARGRRAAGAWWAD